MKLAHTTRTVSLRFSGLVLITCLLSHAAWTQPVAEDQATGPIRINEVLAWNIHTVIGPDNDRFPDFIELVNTESTAADIGGYWLSDDQTNPMKWEVPSGTVLAPGAHIVFWADDDLEEAPYTGFNLARNGEEVVLSNPAGIQVDIVTFDDQKADISIGRWPDGAGAWFYLGQPTVGAGNAGPGYSDLIRTPRPVVSPSAGVYASMQTVQVDLQAGVTFRYTTDGSWPNQDSELYSASLPVSESTVLRVRSFSDGKPPSKAVTQTYIIGENLSLPIISISTDPAYLFDDEIGITPGICVPPEIGAPPPFDDTANFWNNWERPASIEFFNSDSHDGFAENAGIRVFGGAFGRQLCQKPFSVYMRDRYGNTEIPYQLFPTKSADRFTRFILRTSSNDFNRTFIRDAMLTSLVIGRMDIDYQAYRPAIGFVNGEYWGIYNLREKTDRFYTEVNHGADPDAVDLIENMGEVAAGSDVGFTELLDYLRAHSPLQQEDYDWVAERVDIDEYANYMIAELFFRNHDWMHRNTKSWREQDEDGKWRWIMHDVDWGFGGEIHEGPEQYLTNSLEWALQQGDASLLFSGLLTDDAFAHMFAQRFSAHLNTTFDPARIHAVIDSLAAGIRPEMQRHIERWGAPIDVGLWEGELDILREFAVQRHGAIRDHVRQTLQLDQDVEIEVRVEPAGAGTVFAENVELTRGTFIGRFYENTPIRFSAQAHPGYEFLGWEGAPGGGDQEMSLTPTGNQTILARFGHSERSAIVINEIHYNPSADLQGVDSLYEFVELVNASSEDVDVSGYTFESGLTFTFPAGVVLTPGEYVVIAAAPGTYAGLSSRVFGVEAGALSNQGEALRLTDAIGQRIDSVRFNDRTPWPEAPDGEGRSLELKDYRLDNAVANNWEASKEDGGSPGEANGSFVPTQREELVQPESGMKVLAVYPNPFRSEVHLSIRVDEAGPLTIEIYDVLGRTVFSRTETALSAGNRQLRWDGRDVSGRRVSAGHYLYRVQSGSRTATGSVVRLR